MRSVVAFGAFLGSVIGGAIPSIWGGSAISAAGVVLSALGAIAGVVVAVRTVDL